MNSKTLYINQIDNELQHHGILGMKWGVRRYQNKDGSYTRAGLERYRKSEGNYNEAAAKQKAAKSDYKKGSITKSQYKETVSQKRQAKKELSKNYDKLKLDYRADQGKELYRKGQTITNNNNVIGSRTKVALGALAVAQVLDNGEYTNAASVLRLVGLGSLAVNSIVNIKVQSDNRKLRAYYAH